LRAARTLIDSEAPSRTEAEPADEQLRQFCQANAALLDAAHRSLAGPCFADYGRTSAAFEQFLDDSQARRPLTLAFDWKARLAARRGHFDEASRMTSLTPIVRGGTPTH
jgi:hypothetical protein